MALYIVAGLISGIAILVAGTSIVVNLTGDRGSIDSNNYMIAATGIAIGVPLIPQVRRLCSRFMPFDPVSPADMIGLSTLLATAVYSVGISLRSDANVNIGSVSATELVSQAVALIFISYFGVGFLMNRRFRDATDRLGLNSITGRQLGRAVALVAGLFAVTIASGILTYYLEPNLDKQIQDNLKNMTQDVSSIGGALLLGISAGAGEEILFRGAIQPRYGIIFTSIVFASLHIQYGISLTIVGIFFVSILLGIERKRVNTTASMVTHVIYDVLAVIMGSL
ncbi:MAG: type II CAAX endopeptidase family protein [Nitrolancea sp.]